MVTPDKLQAMANAVRAQKEATSALLKIQHGAPTAALYNMLIDVQAFSPALKMELDDAPARVSRSVTHLTATMLATITCHLVEAGSISKESQRAAKEAASKLMDTLKQMESDIESELCASCSGKPPAP